MNRNDPLANPEPLIRKVYAYVAYRMGDGAEAEDATSATFERALRYRNSFDSARGDPVAWLFGIARRCVSEALVERSLQARELPELEAPGDMVAETVGRIELRAALEQLDLRDRELLALRYGSDLSTRQIAELMGTTPGSVDTALHRARRRLRVVLEGGELPPEQPLLSSRAPAPPKRPRLRVSR